MPTNRELWEQGIRSKHPDKSFDNEDDLFAASMEGYDEEHDWNKRARAENQQVLDVIDEHPDIAMFMTALMQGENPAKAFSYLDRALSTLRNGDDEFNAQYAVEVNKRRKEKADSEGAQAALAANSEQAEQAIQEFMDEKGMDEQQLSEFMQAFQDILTDLSQGSLNKDILDMVYEHINRDADISDSFEAGRVQGRNDKIEARKTTEQNTDGLPVAPSGGEAPETEPVQRRSRLADIAEQVNRRNSIFQ